MLILKLALFVVLSDVFPSFALEECGDGYMCAMCDSGYGCAPVSGGACVCCSAGQPTQYCKESNGSTLPACPANGAPGSGCIRALHEAQREKVSFEEECGDGYTCVVKGAYGCAKIPATSDSPLVCCSVGQSKDDCTQASQNGTVLPYCPSGGATGEGCLREPQKHKKESADLDEQRAPESDETLLEECGPGYTCEATKYAYGCAKMPVSAGNFTLVCCTGGQPEKLCAMSSKTGNLPYCPAGGATGGGCLRLRGRGAGTR